jgi:hypothetical protein
MESKYGFVKMTIAEFGSWILSQRIARTILTVQQHHTWSPNYTHFIHISMGVIILKGSWQ